MRCGLKELTNYRPPQVQRSTKNYTTCKEREPGSGGKPGSKGTTTDPGVKGWIACLNVAVVPQDLAYALLIASKCPA